MSEKSLHHMRLEDRHGAHNYHPIPVVLERGQGVHVWDVDGKRYLDFLSAYSAVNQGHSHPKLVAALTQQASTLALSSRAFYNNALGEYERFVTGYFGYDKILPMNTGVEAWDTANKLARRWGYAVKGIPDGAAVVVHMQGNFHGRSIAALSASTDPDTYGGFGPTAPGFATVPFNDLAALRALLQRDGARVAGICLEPIQGEAGIVIPDAGYLRGVRALCDEFRVLLIADEIQTGCGRTGRLLAVQHDGVRPDVLVLGKALSGGLLPISGALADDEVMLQIKPGQHGSTFGGYPVACKVATAALEVLRDERLPENAAAMGAVLRAGLEQLQRASPIVGAVRARGLMAAIDITPTAAGKTAWDVCIKMRDLGLLAKPTHDHTIRLAPPLCITQAQVEEAVHIVQKAVKAFDGTA